METGLKFDEVLTIQAFLKIGGFSRYQVRSLLALFFPVLQFSILFAGLPHFIQLPSISCLKSDHLEACSESFVCSSSSKYLYDYTAFNSVIHEWNLICDSSYSKYYICISFIVSLIIGILITSFISERFGRLTSLRYTLGLSSLFEFLLLGSGDVYYFTIFIFLLGLTIAPSLFTSLVYACEITAGFSRTVSSAYLLVILSIGYIPAYYIIYTMRSWRPLILTSLLIGFFGLIFSFLLKESPRYLAIIRARYSKARANFEYISKVNRVQMFEEHLQGEILNEYSETIRKRQIIDLSGLDNSELPEMSEQRDAIAAPFEYLGGAANAVDRERDLDRGLKFGYLDLFKEDLRKTVLIMCFFWLILGVNFYSVTHTGFVYDDERVNLGVVVGINVFGTFVWCFLSYFVRSKKLLIFTLLVGGVCVTAFGAVLIADKRKQEVFSICVWVNSGLWFSAVKYSLEVMPTPSRCIGLGLMQVFCIIGMIFGYFLAYYAVSGVVVAGVVVALLGVLISKLSETSGELSDFTAWTIL